jgi:pyruvyltransferase
VKQGFKERLKSTLPDPALSLLRKLDTAYVISVFRLKILFRKRLKRQSLPTYRLSKDHLSAKGKIPLTWWTVAPNFGDLLSPWLVEKLTGKEATLKNKGQPCYLAIGSVIKRAKDNTIVWGSGGFGDEGPEKLNRNAAYTAVRGPLTRNLLRTNEIECPPIYGDPALLTPYFYNPRVKKTHDVGVILRWSESKRHEADFGKGVKKISLKTDDIEGTLDEILSCRTIITSSLHGLIIADAYDIPSAWITTGTTRGKEFKFYDYFITVDKVRPLQKMSFRKKITTRRLIKNIKFDSRRISYDYVPLIKACPFLEVKE